MSDHIHTCEIGSSEDLHKTHKSVLNLFRKSIEAIATESIQLSDEQKKRLFKYIEEMKVFNAITLVGDVLEVLNSYKTSLPSDLYNELWNKIRNK